MTFSLSYLSCLELHPCFNVVFNFLETFKDTLVIFASDHGARFADMYSTSEGRAEEKLPLNLLVFPDWFKTEYSDLYTTLQVSRMKTYTQQSIYILQLLTLYLMF